MGRKVRSKWRLGKKIRLGENKVLTYIVMEKSNNRVVGIVATPYQVYTLTEKISNLGNIVVSDLLYNDKVSLVDFLNANSRLVLVKMYKDTDYLTNKILRLEQAKINYTAKLNYLKEKTYYVLEAYDDTVKTIDDIKLDLYHATNALDIAMNKIDKFSLLIESCQRDLVSASL